MGDSPEDEAQPPTREQEFLQYFARSQRGLYAYILALVYDPNIAADLLQETNIVLWQKFDGFERGSNFFAWARKIAQHMVLRHRQASDRRITTIEPALLVELAEQVSELEEGPDNWRSVLAACLGQLRDRDRELVTARYRPGASVRALATRLGRSENSVSHSLTRIRSVLGECVQRKLNAEDRLTQS